MTTSGIGLRLWLPVCLLALLSTLPVSAQRSDTKAADRVTPPGGVEIAAAARAATPDIANAVTTTLSGKSFRFTPARAKANAGNEAFAGVLENGAPGQYTGLPVGRYNIYVARVNGQWKAFAESGGIIVRETTRVTASPAAPGTKAHFIERDEPGNPLEAPELTALDDGVRLVWCAGVLILVPSPTVIVVCW